MNDTAEDPTTRIAVDALRDWENDVDDIHRTLLVAARQRALAAVNTTGRQSLAWGAAVAALLVLALGIGFWPQATTAPDLALLQATLEASYLDLEEAQVEELLLDEDLDLYLWLVSETEAT